MNDNIRNSVDAVSKALARIKLQTERGIDLAESPIGGLASQLEELAEELERQTVEMIEVGKRETIMLAAMNASQFEELRVDGELGDLTVVTRPGAEPEALITFTTMIKGAQHRVSAQTTVKALQRLGRKLQDVHGDRTKKPAPAEPAEFMGLTRHRFR